MLTPSVTVRGPSKQQWPVSLAHAARGLRQADASVQVKMPHEREVVCMACSETLVAAGSQNHATLLDSRQQGVVTSIPNADLNHGAFCLGCTMGISANCRFLLKANIDSSNGHF